jgi:lysophospholipase L1-like esterase
MNKLIFILSFCILSFAVKGQQGVFSQGDKVCFVGNSITHGGEFHHNIRLFYITRFPNQEIYFFNCGISGDVTGGILKRMNDDILVHQPTHAIIMIGMNDVKRNLYGAMPTNNADTLKLRQEALTVYKTQLDSIVRIFLSKNIKVTLQKPSIYDQTAIVKTPNNWGVNDALKECADFMESLSIKYKIPTVDYWTLMTDLNKTIQQQDPSSTIVSNDRVHPSTAGHLVMAYQFLKTTIPPQYLSQIILSDSLEMSNMLSQNCRIESFNKKNNEWSVTVKENALPFPITDGQERILDLIPFTYDLNQQILKAIGIKSGKHKLYIDSILIGTFNEHDLQMGINLTHFKQAPQYQQALAVKKVLDTLWKAEANLRDIKWCEIGHLAEFKNKQDLAATKAYLDQRFIEKFQNVPHAKYVRSQYDKYLLIKPNEAKDQAILLDLSKKAYEMAQPKSHIFRLILE